MKAAVSVSGADLCAVIPAQLEIGQVTLIVETDSMEILNRVTENAADAILSHDCEMLLCGEIHDAVFFDKLAEYGVTRYHASGLTGEEAIRRGLSGALPLLRDYAGGTGCHSHDHGDCACHSHGEGEDE